MTRYGDRVEGVIGGVPIPISGTVTVTGAVSLTGTGRDDTDNQTPVATGLPTVVNRMYVADGAGNWDRVASSNGGFNIAGVGALLVQNIIVNAAGAAFNAMREPSGDGITSAGSAGGIPMMNAPVAGNFRYLKGVVDNVDGVATVATEDRLAVAARQYIWNGATLTWDRARENDPGSGGITDRGGTTVTANAAAVVTFAAVPSRMNWLSGFSVDGLGATAALVITVIITGLLGGTQTWRMQIPAGVALPVSNLAGQNNSLRNIEFVRPWRSNAVNTAIVGTLLAFGVGNTTQELRMHGFVTPP